MNHLMIMGHLGSDPEVRFTASGQKVTTLRVAENQRKGGKDETIWWRVTIWGEQQDKIISYFKKGSAIIAQGEMRPAELYNNREGQPQISLNMVAHHLTFPPFGKKEGAEVATASSTENAPSMQQGQGDYQTSAQAQPSPAFTEDEIPF